MPRLCEPWLHFQNSSASQMGHQDYLKCYFPHNNMQHVFCILRAVFQFLQNSDFCSVDMWKYTRRCMDQWRLTVVFMQTNMTREYIDGAAKPENTWVLWQTPFLHCKCNLHSYTGIFVFNRHIEITSCIDVAFPVKFRTLGIIEDTLKHSKIVEFS